MTDTLPALRKTLHINLPPQAAFELFTSDIAKWWPVETHSLSAREGKRPGGLFLDPRIGGRITEHRHDGDLADWAEILEWEPWRKLTLAWHVGRARSNATRIEIRFTGRGDGCELSLLHSGFEALGAAGDAAAANYDEGWDMILGEHFLRACQTDT